MAGAVAGSVSFHLAGAADDADARRLLAAHPMPGAVTVALEREPSAARAAAVAGEWHQILLAREGAGGRAVAVADRAGGRAWINGEETALGYLGGLRVDPAWRRKPRFLRRCFTFLRQLHDDGRAPFYLASVIADNRPARRLLEAGLPGLPAFRPAGPFTTLVLAAGKPRRASGLRIEEGSAARLEEIAGALARWGRRHQLARRWTAEQLADAERCPDLAPEDFLLARRRPGGPLLGCLALWDQRGFKQSRVRGYAPALARLRPLLNLLARAAPGLPRLPPPGTVLPAAFLSHLAVEGDDPGVLRALLDAARRRARRWTRPAPSPPRYLVLGLDPAHPLRRALRGLAPRTYPAMLYLAWWAGEGEAPPALDGRPLHPEVAAL